MLRRRRANAVAYGTCGRTSDRSKTILPSALVGRLDDAVHQVVVHQPVVPHGWPQVQVDDVVLGHAPQRDRMAHPGERVDDLVVPRQLVPEPAS